MSPRNMEPISPMNAGFSVLSQREKQQQFCSLSSRDLGSSNGKLDWAVSADELGKHRRSNENIEDVDEDGIVCAFVKYSLHFKLWEKYNNEGKTAEDIFMDSHGEKKSKDRE
ncbi:hypothetical protein K1719_018474 [Acacia pycnantha]|nr:hypothetical protein K1719_018474 [Acacia pycnantha]